MVIIGIVFISLALVILIAQLVIVFEGFRPFVWSYKHACPVCDYKDFNYKYVQNKNTKIQFTYLKKYSLIPRTAKIVPMDIKSQNSLGLENIYYTNTIQTMDGKKYINPDTIWKWKVNWRDLRIFYIIHHYQLR